MAKTILLSIQPKWVEKILNGEKTIEVRKVAPKLKAPYEVLIYCTKEKPYIVASYSGVVENEKPYYVDVKFMPPVISEFINGKVVGKFTVEKMEEIQCRTVPYKNSQLGYQHFIDNGVYAVSTTNKDNNAIVFERNDKFINTMFKNDDLSKMCLTPQQLYDYIGLGNNAYAWHIDNLVIFDKPKELNEFKKWTTKTIYSGLDCPPYTDDVLITVTKAPQSFMYVEVGK